MEVPQQTHVLAFNQKKLSCAPKSREMNVVYPSNLIDKDLNSWLIVRVTRPPIFLVNDQDVAGVGFGHDFNRVSRDNALS
jgi:hypothetical protein